MLLHIFLINKYSSKHVGNKFTPWNLLSITNHSPANSSRHFGHWNSKFMSHGFPYHKAPVPASPYHRHGGDTDYFHRRISTILVLTPLDSGRNIAMSWLLMPWFLVLHSKQWARYWLCRVDGFYPSVMKDFNYLYNLNITRLEKMLIYFPSVVKACNTWICNSRFTIHQTLQITPLPIHADTLVIEIAY